MRRDDTRVETVLMRYAGRTTACLSSQVGCALGCVFCATGQMGFTRNLRAGEIVAQALFLRDVLHRTSAGAETLRNVVLPEVLARMSGPVPTYIFAGLRVAA